MISSQGYLSTSMELDWDSFCFDIPEAGEDSSPASTTSNILSAASPAAFLANPLSFTSSPYFSSPPAVLPISTFHSKSERGVNPPSQLPQSRGQSRRRGGRQKATQPTDKKLERNRIAASKCRAKQHQAHLELQERARVLQQHHAFLSTTVQGLREELVLWKETLLSRRWECAFDHGSGCEWGKKIADLTGKAGSLWIPGLKSNAKSAIDNSRDDEEPDEGEASPAGDGVCTL